MKQLLRSRTLRLAFDLLAENRLLPKSIVARRPVSRRRFLQKYAPKGACGAEIGVFKGFFTHAILDCARPSRLHLIDPWYLQGEHWSWADGNRSTVKALGNILRWFRRELAAGQVVLHIGFDQDVLGGFPDHYFDWVYLDTTHAYESSMQSLALLDRKVKPTGIILGDDWVSDPSHRHHGLCRAVREFIDGNGYELLVASDEDHQWAISKRAAG